MLSLCGPTISRFTSEAPVKFSESSGRQRRHSAAYTTTPRQQRGLAAEGSPVGLQSLRLFCLLFPFSVSTYKSPWSFNSVLGSLVLQLGCISQLLGELKQTSKQNC